MWFGMERHREAFFFLSPFELLFISVLSPFSVPLPQFLSIHSLLFFVFEVVRERVRFTKNKTKDPLYPPSFIPQTSFQSRLPAGSLCSPDQTESAKLCVCVVCDELQLLERALERHIKWKGWLDMS